MSCAAGPDISESGLVLALDAANIKSLNIPTQADHGYADWYCLVSGTVTYSIINSTGGVIYERNGSTIATLVTASVPQRGTFSITAGRTYYGSVPINLVVEDGHHHIVPLTMMGTQFWSIAVRNNPSTYYVYSPYQSATVNFYDNTAGGLTGTPTSTLSLSAGQSGTFSSNNLTNHWISSTAPIVASATQTGADKTILSPMSTYVYQRYQNNLGTTNFTTPTNNNTYVTYDSTYKVMNMTIADGSGGDCAQGLGLEYLSDTYSWGNVVSDYAIVFPYTATVTTSYWNGSAWVVWDTHSNIAGSITNPPRVLRDGNSGPGVEASTVSGAATNMASGATLWKWEGTAPFYLCINDSADDEFSVLGWFSSRNTSPRSSNVITDMTGRSNNGTLANVPIYSNGTLQFRVASSQYATCTFDEGVMKNTNNTGSWTIETAFKYIGAPTIGEAVVAGRAGCHGGIYIDTDNNLQHAIKTDQCWTGASIVTVTTMTAGNWYHTTMVYNNGVTYTYLNGVYVNTASINLGTYSIFGYNNTFYIGGIPGGSYFTNIDLSFVKCYNRALTAAEVRQNFNATRSRYSI